MALGLGVLSLTGCGGKEGNDLDLEPETQMEQPVAEPIEDAVTEGAFEDISFVDAFYANDRNGRDFMIAFYESEDGDIAYVNDGKDKAFAPYVVENATTDDGLDYLLITVGATQLGYYEEGDDIFLIDDEGAVYAAGRLTEEETEEIHSMTK